MSGIIISAVFAAAISPLTSGAENYTVIPECKTTEVVLLGSFVVGERNRVQETHEAFFDQDSILPTVASIRENVSSDAKGYVGTCKTPQLDEAYSLIQRAEKAALGSSEQFADNDTTPTGYPEF